MDGSAPSWSREEILAEFADCLLVARDSNARPVALPDWLAHLANEFAAVPWEAQTQGVYEDDMPALVRTWWAALEKPGTPQPVVLRRRRDDGWHKVRTTVVDLQDQPEVGSVLIASCDLGLCEAPEEHPTLRSMTPAEDPIARFERPVWLLQELDALGVVISTAGDAREIFGRDPDELEGRAVLEFLHPRDHAAAIEMWTSLLGDAGSTRTIRQRILRPDGSERWIESTVLNRLDDHDAGVVLSVSHDITERRREERALRERAFTDPLTGLPNRAALDMTLATMLTAGDVTVVFVDLDGFKSVNDELGHQVGDRVLEAIARRLSNAVGNLGTVGRWGGDEFVVVGQGDAEDPLRSAIDTAFADPVVLEDHVWHPRCSYGIAHGGPGSDPDQLVVSADTAMYEAKERRAG